MLRFRFTISRLMAAIIFLGFLLAPLTVVISLVSTCFFCS